MFQVGCQNRSSRVSKRIFKVYGCVVTSKDMVEPKDSNRTFNKVISHFDWTCFWAFWSLYLLNVHFWRYIYVFPGGLLLTSRALFSNFSWKNCSICFCYWCVAHIQFNLSLFILNVNYVLNSFVQNVNVMRCLILHTESWN